jgi:hypothetical protein
VKVYLDTDCIIYLVENHPVWCPKVIAPITPIRSAGDELAAAIWLGPNVSSPR